MPGSGRSEIFFIIGMMVLTLILSGIAMYFFVRTYRKEMRQREAQRNNKRAAKAANESSANG